MDDNARIFIEGAMLYGWITILALGKAISWIIMACKNNTAPKKETVKLFWVSGIVQNESDKKPWLLAMSEGELTMDKAKESINFMKENYNVLSVWIDTFDENNVKETVYHECFIDAFGHTVQS